jgi:hypothetical protein
MQMGRGNAVSGSFSWNCAGGMVIAKWRRDGIIDRITIAKDGNSLLISNSKGDTFSATRK